MFGEGVKNNHDKDNRSEMRIEDGRMFSPQKPGLGLEIPEDVIQKYLGKRLETTIILLSRFR